MTDRGASSTTDYPAPLTGQHHQETAQGDQYISPRGGTLHERMQQMEYGLTARDASHLMIQLLNDLIPLHDEGQAHGGLCPHHIAFEDESWDRPILLPSSGPREPHRFMASEQMRASRFEGPQCDVFALGVIAWELMLGASPFVGDDEEQILASIREDQRYDWPEDIPDAFAYAIDWALAYDPQDRYRTAREFGESLEAAVEDLPFVEHLIDDNPDDECTDRLDITDMSTAHTATSSSRVLESLLGVDEEVEPEVVADAEDPNSPENAITLLEDEEVQAKAPTVLEVPERIPTMLDHDAPERTPTLLDPPAAKGIKISLAAAAAPATPVPVDEPEPAPALPPPSLSRPAPSIREITDNVEMSTLRSGVEEQREPAAWLLALKAYGPAAGVGLAVLGLIITMVVASMAPPVPVEGTPFEPVRRHHGVGGKITRAARYEVINVDARNTTNGAFFVGSTEVTQGLWTAVMGDNPMSYRSEVIGHGDAEMPCSKRGLDDRMPVACISFREVLEFCNKLSIMEDLDPAYDLSPTHARWHQGANGYRLPTEQEWVDAATAGSSSAFAPAASADEQCVYGNIQDSMNPITATLRLGMPSSCRFAFDGIAPVAAYEPSKIGLYDTLGNVAEWVWDPFRSEGIQANPPTSRSLRQSTILRGGRWGLPGSSAEWRDKHSPVEWSGLIGFRLVRTR